MATIEYVIDWPKLNRATSKKAAKLLRLVVRETEIVARRKVLYGPYTHGRLAESLYGLVRPDGKGGYYGRVGSGLHYAYFVETGAKPHIIMPRRPDGWLRFYWRKVGKVVTFRKVNHPGQKGKHYLRDALIEVAGRRRFKVFIYDN